jgi:hypothetical protein
MSKTLAAILATALLTTCVTLAQAADVSTKKLSIKGSTDPTKRQIQVQSVDAGVTLSGADNPGASGASVHVYSATQDFCAVLASGTNWKQTKSGAWKYADKTTKNGASVGNGKLAVKIKSNVTFSLAGSPQGTVNAQVQFGTGTRYCMRCSGAKKDTTKIFLAKACAAAACDPEPSSCPPVSATTTTTTPVTTTTTTTACVAPGHVVGSLTVTVGRFNYNATVGLPGANAACSSSFPGSHPCTLTELQCAPSSELAGLKDTSNMPVLGFWAIDPTANRLTAQCHDDVGFPCPGMPPVCPPGHTWEYGTAHTMSRGQRVSLNNATGALGALETGLQCNTFPPDNWVGCCQ